MRNLYRLFRALALGTPPSAALLAQLNARFTAFAHKRRIVCEKGKAAWGWNTAAHDPDSVLAPILLSAADLLVSGRSPQLRQCEDEACGWLFLDRSQAGQRRWCSMADCGNRAKARRHYRKK